MFKEETTKSQSLELAINDEFKTLVPPLAKIERELLEKSIEKDGCLSPIIITKMNERDTIIDGFNRYEICKKFNQPFTTLNLEFNSEYDIKSWIIKNQFSRRNLNMYQKARLALQYQEYFSKLAYEKKLATLKQNVSLDNQNSEKRYKTEQINTNKELSKIAGVSHHTIDRVRQIEKCADDETKTLLETNKKSINQVFTEITKKQFREIKEGVKQEKLLKKLSDKKLQTELYEVIYINVYEKFLGKYYKNLTLPAKKDCLLFIWSRIENLEKTISYIKKWGFKYVCCFVWDCDTERRSYELLLVAEKGDLNNSNGFKTPDFIHTEKYNSSCRPLYYNDLIEKLYPIDRYLEISNNQPFNEKWQKLISID